MVQKMSKLYRYSALNVVEHNSSLLKCELFIVTSFQRGQDGKEEKVNFHWRNLTNVTLARRSKLASTVMSHIDSMNPCYGVMKMASL